MTLALALVVPPSADATLFWANSGNGTGTTIGRAADDGTGADQSFLSSEDYPRDVAANSTHIYWGSGFPTVHVIERANVDGTGPDATFIQPSDCVNAGDLNFPKGITVDATHVYWIGDAGKIGRAKLDGTDVDCSWLSLTPPNAALLGEIAVDDQYVYWTQAVSTTPIVPGKIGRADKDDPTAGGGPDPDFIDNLGDVRGLAITSDHVYWSEDNESQIGRADLDGGNVNRSFITSVGTARLAATDEYLYYPSFGASSGAGAILRRPIDGSGTGTVLVSGANFPMGLAVTVPRGTASPTSRDFGTRSVGERSTTQKVTLTATGDQALTIDTAGITLTGTDPGEFTVAGGTCVAGTTSLATGETCTVEVVFAPSSVGAKAAELRVATNAGAFSASLSGTASPAPTAPGTPTGVTATAGLLRATVSWTAPSSDGGSAITSYTATASPGGKTCTATTTTCTITGLLNTRAYTFTVTATNAAGTSPASTATKKARPYKKLKMKKPRAQGARITSAVRVTGAATITQTIRTTTNRKACAKRIRATKKKTYTVTCPLNRTTKNALKKRRQTLTVTTTVLTRKGATFQATHRIRVNKTR